MRYDFYNSDARGRRREIQRLEDREDGLTAALESVANDRALRAERAEAERDAALAKYDRSAEAFNQMRAERDEAREKLAMTERRMDVIVRDRDQVEAELNGVIDTLRDRLLARGWNAERDDNTHNALVVENAELRAKATEVPGLSWAECITQAENWASAPLAIESGHQEAAAMAQAWVAIANAKGRG